MGIEETYLNIVKAIYESSVQFSSATQSCSTLCDPMNQTINAGKDVKKREHSCTVGGNVN